MRQEEKSMIRSAVIPFLFVFLLWMIRAVEVIGRYDLGFLGIYPLTWQGLIGIVTGPLVHSDYPHLVANSIPLMVLGSALFYFYKDLAPRIFLLVYFLTGALVWIAARPAFHVGASGVVYGLATFILASGVIRRHTGLMAVALVVVFLYGSMVWGIFPDFFPGKPVSWESHLLGMVVGLILSVYYRKEGPQRKKYEWEIEEEEKRRGWEEEKMSEGEEEKGRRGEEVNGRRGEEENGEDPDKDAYWNITLTDEDIKNIRRVYRPGRQPGD